MKREPSATGQNPSAHLKDPSPNRHPLNQRAWIYLDESGSENLTETASPEDLLHQYPFQATLQGDDNWGYGQPVFWVLVPLDPLDSHVKWFLEFAYPLMDKLDLWLKFPHSEWLHRPATGDQRTWATREVESPDFYFQIPRQTTHLLLRLETHGAMLFPLALVSEAQLHKDERLRQFGYGLFFGALLIMIFCNAVVYVLAAERSYLFYMALLTSVTLYQAAMSGFGFMYLWPGNGYWINEHIQPITVGLALWFVCLFSRDVLQPDRFQPGLSRLLLALGWSGALLALAGALLPFRWLIHVSALWPLVVILVVVYAGFNALQARQRGAGLFVVAWCAGFLGAALFILQQLGLLTPSWISEHGLKLGLILNMTLLSFVLVSHMQQLRREKEKLEKAARDNYELALIDGLTGVPNRRAFDDRLVSEFERTSRDGTSMALLMIDIDYFKKYNDAQGHRAGDEALIRVALIMRNCLRRPTDSLYRYGGEEFSVILADTDQKGADHIATRIMRAIRSLCLPHPDSPYKQITVSIGISLTTGRDDTAGNLLQRSDAALYRAKRQGRNTSCLGEAGSGGPVVNIGDYFKNTPKDSG
ncbi:MAG TPA: diguanylate cyclase [Dongiaceae bacterium]|nr:diguanylate cyclase [Dongiaceae bacterium]